MRVGKIVQLTRFTEGERKQWEKEQFNILRELVRTGRIVPPLRDGKR